MGLAAKDKDAVPALAAALKDDAVQVRVESARTLRAMGPSATAAVPALTQALADKETRVAVLAAAALVMVEPGKKAELVPILTGLLGSAHPYTRGIAARTLGEVGPAAKDAAPALRKLLADETDYFDPLFAPTVGGTAAEALRQITGSTEK
jgi:HEAT repeat protein